MKKLVVVGMLAGCTNNEPQYVNCTTTGPAAADVCKVMAGGDDGTGMPAIGRVQVHVPLLPEARWSASDRAERAKIQAEVDMTAAGIEVPVYRMEHYDLSVEWVVRNFDTMPGKFRIDLNGANEVAAYDSSMLIPADPNEPAPPPLAGNIPIDIGPETTVSGVFREDQLREAAIDLDQITRGLINPFAATLTINKQADEFQPLTPLDLTTDPPTGGEPAGPAVPRAAWRNIVRVDLALKADRLMELEVTVRLREHTDIIPAEGLNAPEADLNIMNPPLFMPTLPP